MVLYIMIGKLILLYIIQALHILICVIALLAPYLSNNVLFLSICIFYYISIVSLWNIFGKCFLTVIENKIAGKNPSSNSCVSSLVSRLFGSHTEVLFSVIPLFNTIVCLLKINGTISITII